MKIHLLLLLIFCSFSCKNKSQTKGLEETLPAKLDTIVCEFNNKTIVDSVNTSMFNIPYTSKTLTTYLLSKKIETRNKENITICYDKEVNVLLIKKKDTVFNLKINMDFLNKEYFKFYSEVLTSHANQSNDSLKLNIPKPTNNLKLDSMVHSGARTNYIYYTCYNTDYRTNKRYKSSLGIDYLNKKGESFLSSQLIEIKK